MAPSAARTVALLDFLASHPTERFGVSELARRLDASKATLHALVATLTDAGYLLRHPVDKTYSLGPALVAVGNAAASRQIDVVDHARGEMRRLADELDVLCVASAAIGDEIVILGREGDLGPLAPDVRVGHRLPLVPPLGTVFMAWSSDAEIEAWLQRTGPSAPADRIARFRSAVAAVRDRGYSLALEADARIQIGRALGARDPGADASRLARLVEELGHEEYVLAELEHASSYRLSMIAAPVFGADGSVVLALTLFGFRASLDPVEIRVLADRLVEATRIVTKSVHGRPN
ncbi:MAG TPA: helix-turn-helix domain-containing protein [Acidimicrobiia bacterium]|nr:helix-turn-helix domain-containing protein [Acidimicrobiia bacterium]